MIDVKQIKNPTKEYRAKPFWSLNGKLKKEELLILTNKQF